MEPENDGLEDDVPFQLGILGSMLIFRGVLSRDTFDGSEIPNNHLGCRKPQ